MTLEALWYFRLVSLCFLHGSYPPRHMYRLPSREYCLRVLKNARGGTITISNG